MTAPAEANSSGVLVEVWSVEEWLAFLWAEPESYYLWQEHLELLGSSFPPAPSTPD